MTEKTFGRVAGRIVKRPNKTGFSYGFSIVKNQRNYHTRKSEHVPVANIGTVKDSEFDTQAKSFWSRVDTTLKILVDSGKIYRNSAHDVCRKFEKVIKRPTAPVAAPVPVEKPKSNPDVAARVEERFKGLL